MLLTDSIVVNLDTAPNLNPDPKPALIPGSETEWYHYGKDLAEWLARLTANANVATVLGSIQAS
jgi:hypothetical protein